RIARCFHCAPCWCLGFSSGANSRESDTSPCLSVSVVNHSDEAADQPALRTRMSTDAPLAIAPERPEPVLLPSRRLHGLDWLRAAASLLVLGLHSGIAYVVGPFPGLVGGTPEIEGHLAVDFVTWWINGFIMPLFFVLSGFVGFALMTREGAAGFA